MDRKPTIENKLFKEWFLVIFTCSSVIFFFNSDKNIEVYGRAWDIQMYIIFVFVHTWNERTVWTYILDLCLYFALVLPIWWQSSKQCFALIGQTGSLSLILQSDWTAGDLLADRPIIVLYWMKKKMQIIAWKDFESKYIFFCNPIFRLTL